MYRPWQFETAIRQPFCFWQNALSDRKSDPGSRWSVKGQGEAQHTSGIDVEQQRKPRATQRCTSNVVYELDINLGMVDLDDLKRSRRLQAYADRCKLIVCCFSALSGSKDLSGRTRGYTGRDRLSGWRFETCSDAVLLDFLEQLLP